MKVDRCNFREFFGKIAKMLCRFIESLKSHICLNPANNISSQKKFRKLRTCQQVQLSQTQMCLQVQHKLPNSLCWEYNGKFNAHLQKELVLHILQGELITSYNFLINSLCTCYGIALVVGSLQYAKLLSNLPDPFVAKMFITVL